MPKQGKPATDVTSYRPISLLPILSKLFEKLLLKRLKPILDEKHIIPTHQFGFRHNHSTTDQVHRITTFNEKTLEEKQVSSTILLEVSQAFDQFWHERLFHKLELLLPPEYSQLLKYYLSDRFFRVKQDEYSCLKPIKARIPQGSVLDLLYYCKRPISRNLRELLWRPLLMTPPSWQKEATLQKPLQNCNEQLTK